MTNINSTQDYLSTLDDLESQVESISTMLSLALQNATRAQDLSGEVFWSNPVSSRLTDLYRDVQRLQGKVKALAMVLPKDTDLESTRR